MHFHTHTWVLSDALDATDLSDRRDTITFSFNCRVSKSLRRSSRRF